MLGSRAAFQLPHTFIFLPGSSGRCFLCCFRLIFDTQRKQCSERRDCGASGKHCRIVIVVADQRQGKHRSEGHRGRGTETEDPHTLIHLFIRSDFRNDRSACNSDHAFGDTLQHSCAHGDGFCRHKDKQDSRGSVQQREDHDTALLADFLDHGSGKEGHYDRTDIKERCQQSAERFGIPHIAREGRKGHVQHLGRQVLAQHRKADKNECDGKESCLLAHK